MIRRAVCSLFRKKSKPADGSITEQFKTFYDEEILKRAQAVDPIKMFGGTHCNQPHGGVEVKFKRYTNLVVEPSSSTGCATVDAEERRDAYKHKPAPQLMPMGAVTYAVACTHCVNRRWSEKCPDCRKEIKSGFELDANTFLRWIPVGERLPEVQERVLAVTESGYIRMDCIRKCDGTWFQELFDSSKITHWMALPAPPEEDKDEQA